VLGEPINEWAFGDIHQLLITFDKVLDWDTFRDNEFTSKTKHEAAWNDVREGLIKLREHVRANADQIRAERRKNGLENRDQLHGIGVASDADAAHVVHRLFTARPLAPGV